MRKQHRLQKNEDFQQVFQHGFSAANRQFVVYQLQKPEQQTIRIGLSVSKKLGNAVLRNRTKRLMKEVLRDTAEELKQDRDVVIIARKPVTAMDLGEIEKSLRHVLNVAKLFQKPQRKNMKR
ncbi:ribonuclease P protein component [Alkalicoccus daliensis]|uniref:Ribonuclease P protein component n=1 Tax=Alkalicoccus daliensis TaxID=745820 RepID=A0A1H0FNM9_9BACI|nr:ribonuclease P protein component [Alkalicoccus daliensis]SDN96089.1 ribonuclease P protein component [Alkalicoccus daliensis]